MRFPIIAVTLLCVDIATCAKLGGGSKPNTHGNAEPLTKSLPPNKETPHKGEHEKTTDEHKSQHDKPHFRDDYVYLEDHKMFVKLNENPKPWADAREYCEDEGAGLAVITSDEEAKEMTEMLRQLPTSHAGAWIGLHDLFADGEFVTIDGEPMESANVFKVWATDEPNNKGGNEHCVLLEKDGKLNDVACEDHFPFLCKKDDEAVEFNHECDTSDPEYHLMPDGEQCYKMHTTAKSWRDAFVTCKAEEGNLAVVNSDEEAQLYVEAFEKVPLEAFDDDTHKNIFHIGFHELFKLHEYLTIDGQTLKEAGFNKWAKGKPDSPETERCGSLHRSGLLNDIDCESKAMFVCEKESGEHGDEKPNVGGKKGKKDKKVGKDDEPEAADENEGKEEENPEENNVLQARKKRQSTSTTQ